MRVVIAPDKFAGTLTAVQAAEAIAEGWRRAAPRHELSLVPVSDGGPGFLGVLHAAVGGSLVTASVSGPLAEAVSVTVLRDGDTAYVEAAQACGRGRLPEPVRDPGATTTYGVGELLELAAASGEVRRCVVGLGGSATNDGGAGMLAALGARPPGTLRHGGLALRDLTTVDLGPARVRSSAWELVAATDVDNPLLGPDGASTVFGPQQGAASEQVTELEAALEHWADLTDRACARRAGAGAAGGLGHGLFLLGARRASGIEAVLRAVRFAERVRGADLVVTGEGSLDLESLRGKAVGGVARAAFEHGVPCLALAGQVELVYRDMSDLGVEAAYSMDRFVGSVREAMVSPQRVLSALAERTARTL